MKHRTDLFLAFAMTMSAIGCVVAWHVEISLLLYITVVPFFCAQLLLCRVTTSRAVRSAPVLPVLLALGMAGFYFIRDSGWDRLGALIFGLAAIAPAVGIALGWCVWWICRVLHKRKQHEGA